MMCDDNDQTIFKSLEQMLGDGTDGGGLSRARHAADEHAAAGALANALLDKRADLQELALWTVSNEVGNVRRESR